MIKILAFIWVGLTIGINVFALTGLLYHFGLAETNWQSSFATMGQIYDQISAPIFMATANMLDSQFDFTLPEWVRHAVIAYAASASAIAVSGLGITSREGFVDGMKSSGLSVAWPIGIAVMIWKGFRAQIVSKFARDHSKILAGYIAAVALVYFGAVFINNSVFAAEAPEPSAPALEAAEDEAPSAGE